METSKKNFTEIYDIVHVPPELAGKDWAVYRIFIEQALEHSAVKADFHDQIVSGEMGLLAAMDKDGVVRGAATLQFIQVPGELVLRIVHMAGINFYSCEAFLPKLLLLAEKNEAKGIEFLGRKGFERWAKSFGARPVHVVYRIEV